MPAGKCFNLFIHNVSLFSYCTVHVFVCMYGYVSLMFACYVCVQFISVRVCEFFNHFKYVFSVKNILKI